MKPCNFRLGTADECIRALNSSQARQGLGLFVVAKVSYYRGMRETSLPTPMGFAELPKTEQVRYLMALWDQISEQSGEIAVPESHLSLALARLERYRQNNASTPAFDVLDRLSQNLK